MICNAGRCASVDYQRHHPKPAPVTRPKTSTKPEYSCGGHDAGFKGWSAICHAAKAQSTKPGGDNPISWIADHFLVVAQFCLVGCVSLSFQGGQLIFSLEAWSLTRIFYKKLGCRHTQG
jgi:hypothetical protein